MFATGHWVGRARWRATGGRRPRADACGATCAGRYECPHLTCSTHTCFILPKSLVPWSLSIQMRLVLITHTPRAGVPFPFPRLSPAPAPAHARQPGAAGAAATGGEGRSRSAALPPRLPPPLSGPLQVSRLTHHCSVHHVPHLRFRERTLLKRSIKAYVTRDCSRGPLRR